MDSLAGFEPDLGVVVAFGQFLPKRVRELPRLGYLINGHASLLPRYRGAAPIARALLAGESESGVSVMRVEREMDAGPVALVRKTRIDPEENSGELAERLSHLCADAIEEAISQIATRTIRWTPQDASAATFAPKIERGDARLDWSESATALVRRVRAMAPTPGAFTLLDRQPLRILAARAEAGRTNLPPGMWMSDDGARARIATGDGWLLPAILQRPGRRPLEIVEFLRGRPISDGTLLGEG